MSQLSALAPWCPLEARRCWTGAGFPVCVGGWLPLDLGVEQGVHEGGLAQTRLSHAQDVEAEALAD